MRGSAKGEEPETLRAWKAGQQAACIEPRYVDLSLDARQAMKQSLLIEQTGQCVYCGRAIALEDHDMHHVEHFRPRTPYRDLELVYENLFLSCGPKQPKGNARPTCGDKKKGWFDVNCHVEPAPEETCQSHFAFASDGRINGAHSPEANRMIDVLNLNHSELITERSTLIEHLDGELAKGVSFSQLIDRFLDISQTGTRVSFANVAIAYLRNQRELMQQNSTLAT